MTLENANFCRLGIGSLIKYHTPKFLGQKEFEVVQDMEDFLLEALNLDFLGIVKYYDDYQYDTTFRNNSRVAYHFWCFTKASN